MITYVDEDHHLYMLAVQVAAMASAVNGLEKEDLKWAKLQVEGICRCLEDISDELYEMSGWKEIDNESEKKDAE